MLLRDAEAPLNAADLPTIIEDVEKRMKQAADNLDFEAAVQLRDQLFELRGMSASKPSAGRAKSRKR